MRLANPLLALAMAALPVACLLTGEFNRRGQSRRILLAILLAFTLQLLDIGLRNLAGRSDIAVPLLYVNVLLPLAVTAFLLWRDSAHGAPRRLAEQSA
jgi:lipopolysaccharide export system permease protein